MVSSILRVLSQFLILLSVTSCISVVDKQELKKGIETFNFSDNPKSNEIAVYFIATDTNINPHDMYELKIADSIYHIQLRRDLFVIINKPDNKKESFTFRFCARRVSDDEGWKNASFIYPKADQAQRVFLLLKNLRVEQITEAEAIESIVEIRLFNEYLYKKDGDGPLVNGVRCDGTLVIPEKYSPLTNN